MVVEAARLPHRPPLPRRMISLLRHGRARRKAVEEAAGAGGGLMSAATAVRTAIARAGMAAAKRETAVVGARETTGRGNVIATTVGAAKAATEGATGEGAAGGIEVGMIAGMIGAGEIDSLSIVVCSVAVFFFLVVEGKRPCIC